MSAVGASTRASIASSERRLTDTLLLAAIAIGTVALSVPALWNLSRGWQVYEQYGHGYLMACVAGWLVYVNRGKVRRAIATLDPPPFGAPLVLAAASFEVLTFVGDFRFGSGVGVPLLIGAVGYAVGGATLLRAVYLPLLFVALIVPPGFLIRPTLVRLKLIVTELAVSVLQRWGEPVLAEGNRIFLPEHELIVADACSGLTSIVTLLPIACLVAFALLPGWWRRLVVIASVIPVAIAANVVRVIVTVKLVPIIGLEAAQGMLHQGFGVVAFGVGTLAVIGFARLLR
jgi:exosortase